MGSGKGKERECCCIFWIVGGQTDDSVIRIRGKQVSNHLILDLI